MNATYLIYLPAAWDPHVHMQLSSVDLWRSPKPSTHPKRFFEQGLQCTKAFCIQDSRNQPGNSARQQRNPLAALVATKGSNVRD